MRTCWITLGRYGDILNTLPLVFKDHLSGNQPTMVCSKEYVDILEGCSYVQPLAFQDHYSKPFDALAWAERLGFDAYYVCQCYGTTHDQLCDSFAKEAWRLVGRLEEWGELPLVFNNRDQAREQALLNGYPRAGKPVILVSTAGLSSPFSGVQELWGTLEPFRGRYDIIDLSQVKAERFYDLLGLYEIASLLISTDSGPLHLAQATPSLKVAGLIVDYPSLWYGAPDRPNHVLRIRYGEFTHRKGELAALLERGFDAETPRLVHVFSEYHRHDMLAVRRNNVAKQTWQTESRSVQWVSCPVHDSTLGRNATSVGEQKPVPFVRDIFQRGVEAARANDVIMFTNDDTCIVEGAVKLIMDGVRQYGAIYGSRREQIRIDQPMSKEEILKGYPHPGADIFAFSRGWWSKHGHEFPDMLLTFEAWDLVMKRLIEATGGRHFRDLCYHEIHESYWHSAAHRETTGNLYNRELTRQWLEMRRISWAEAFRC